MRVGVRVSAPPVRSVVAESKSGRGRTGSVRLLKRPAAVGGPYPSGGRMSTG